MMPIKTKHWVAGVMVGTLGLLSAERTAAQTFSVVHNFGWGGGGGNYDGAVPRSGLAVLGATLYGTTFSGGTNGAGVIFKVTTDGQAFTTLHNCKDAAGEIEYLDDTLAASSSTLYGISYYGGTGNGTIFRINTNGTGFTLLHSFTQPVQDTNGDGYLPGNPMVLSGSTLFGTTPEGGTYGLGTVFRVGTSGGFTVLRSFSPSDGAPGGNLGSAPLVLSDSTLFGMAGDNIFSMSTSGTGFNLLFSSNIVRGALTLSGGKLYWLSDAVYSISTNGTGLRLLHSITNQGNPLLAEHPRLVISGNTLYGTVWSSGGSDNGMVFAMNTDGTGFTILHRFTSTDSVLGTNADGAYPNGLVLSGNVLYGTATFGGSYGNGTVFSITLPVVRPQLTITPVSPNVILTWPTTPVGFTLQSTTNLVPPVAWATASLPPVLVNSLNTVTNPISTGQQFFRLVQ